MSDVVVYSAIFGGYDHYRPDLNRSGAARYVLFTDKKVSVDGWEVRVVPNHLGRRKTARYYKLNSHLLFPDVDYTIWHDGWLQFTEDPLPLLRFLGDNCIAMERHPARNCIYQEAAEVIRVKKADPGAANAQVAQYRQEGFPKGYGLFASFLMVRRNAPELAVLEDAWWREVDRHTLRDQLSFNYVLWKLGMGCSTIERPRGRFYRSLPHATGY